MKLIKLNGLTYNTEIYVNVDTISSMFKREYQDDYQGDRGDKDHLDKLRNHYLTSPTLYCTAIKFINSDKYKDFTDDFEELVAKINKG